MTKLVQEAIEKLKKEMGVEMEKLKEENQKGREEILVLREENDKIKKQMIEMGRKMDEIEQYSRKDSLILSGGGFPEVQSGKHEAPEETREITKKVIEEQLGVKLKGQISACHRLRNNRRVLVKFQDSDDRSSVYEAKFKQGEVEQGKRITIHENLTAQRAKQIQVLGEMWDKGEVANYYTKHGVIMARKTREQRYVAIRPDMTRDEIKATTEGAGQRAGQQTNQNQNFLKSQSLSNIPSGRVANQKADLEQFVKVNTRSSGRTGRNQGQESSSHQ